MPIPLNGQEAPIRALPDDPEWHDIVDFIEAHGRQREAFRSNQPGGFNDVDYIAGAAAVFFALGWNERIPARWIFGPLGGKSPFRDPPTYTREEFQRITDLPPEAYGTWVRRQAEKEARRGEHA